MNTLIQSDFFTNIDVKIQFDAPIGNMTYFDLGGSADVLALPQSIDALSRIVKKCYNAGIPLRILGKGANLLVDDDGVEGVVIKLSHDCFKACSVDAKNAAHNLHCMAGADLSQTIMQSAREGLQGLEGLSGIPASIGGGIQMNAGGKFGSIVDSLTSITCLSENGELISHSSDEFCFEYRQSNITEPIILSGTFTLTPDDPIVIRDAIKEIFAWKKSMQPLADTSAGCAFKNLINKINERVSAGKLIDESGLKGFSIGGAMVSHQHANFITTNSTAKAQDVIAIMHEVKKRVFDNTGIHLQQEVVVWSRNSETDQ
jgi:UDP-N-acetylmuramate dehydrogenase